MSGNYVKVGKESFLRSEFKLAREVELHIEGERSTNTLRAHSVLVAFLYKARVTPQPFDYSANGEKFSPLNNSLNMRRIKK